MDAEIPGFVTPVHRALTEPILMGGAPRSIAIVNGTLAAALGILHAAVIEFDAEAGELQPCDQRCHRRLGTQAQQVADRGVRRQRTMARLPSFGMIKDSEEALTLRGWIEIPYFAAMS